MTMTIKEANELAVSRMQNAQPEWIDIKPANEVLKDFDKHTLLHAGPPIKYEDMCAPMQGAIFAALIYEGLAADEAEARKLAESGKIKYAPCHHYDAVGPMTGIISYSMPLIVVQNDTDKNFSYSTLNEGKGDVARFGGHSPNTIKRLKWIENVLAPALKKALSHYGKINLKVLIAQALQMGDELHMRNTASSNLFIKTIIEGLSLAAKDKEEMDDLLKFILESDQFFLNFAMAACKAAADAAHNVEGSTIVTAMARNGVDIGIRVSSLGDRWFTAPASDVEALYFAGYSKEDANPDIGDSAIMETGGLGGFAIAASPAIVRFLGAGTYKDAVNYTMDMYEINADESKQYMIPTLDFRGTPTGIDIKKVVETNIEPIINTAVVSKKAGGGMIGAGIARAPIAMFEEALMAFAENIGI